MNRWVGIVKTLGFSTLLLFLLVSFLSWVLYPVFIPKEMSKQLKNRLS